MTLPDMIDHKAVKQMEPHEYNMRVWADKRAIEVINRKKARIRELESALAFWMPDENEVPQDAKEIWDKHIELLPPAADRIGAVLSREPTANREENL